MTVAGFDIHGHKVLEQKAHGYATVIDISSLPQGSYIVSITTTRGSISSKLTIEH